MFKQLTGRVSDHGYPGKTTTLPGVLSLRAKSGLQGPLVQVEPQEPEENLDLRDMPVLRDLL